MNLGRRIISPLLILTVVTALMNSVFLRSFWLDECVSVWLTDDSFAELWKRLHRFPGHSTLFNSTIFVWRNLVGSSEWALRLPSLFGLGLAAFGTYTISRRYAETVPALTAAAVLFSSTFVQHSLTVRPYAMALAAAVWSVEFLLRAASIPRWNLCWAWMALSAAAAAHLHYLFGGILLVHLLVLFLGQGERGGNLRRFAVVVTVIVLTFLPIASQLLQTAHGREGLTFAQGVSITALLSIAQEFPLEIAAVVGLSIAGINRIIRKNQRRALPAADLLALAGWALFPWILFPVLSMFLGVSITHPRYLLWSFPPLAVLLSIALSQITKGRIRMVAVAAVLLVTIARNTERVWAWEDWREASAIVRGAGLTGVPVLLSSGLVELKNENLLRDRGNWEYLNAPFEVYHPGAEVLPLPYGQSESETFNAVVLPRFSSQGRFLFVAVVWQPESESNPVARLVKTLAPIGFSARPLSIDGPVWVVEFSKPHPAL